MQCKNKHIAVMQPYIFPYLGYFQLINSVNDFVFYDDVNFIKQGWINRNRILGANEPILFTVPLRKMSSNKMINEVEINTMLYQKWKNKFTKSLLQIYSKAPYFEEVYNLVQSTLKIKENELISSLAIKSIKNVSEYLNLDVKFITSSKQFGISQNLERTQRLLYICEELNSKNYINTIGGKELYSKAEFSNHGVKLHFLKPKLIKYKQFKNEFETGLSIIDVLMFNNKQEVLRLLENYDLE